MNKNELKKLNKEIEVILEELGIEKEISENGKYLISDRKKNEILSYLEKEISEEDINQIFEKKIQIHEPKDRDIKIDSRKSGIYGIKLIYHRKKDDSKEYRIFISFKDDNKNLRRIRFLNDDIKKIHNDEKKMIEFYKKLSELDIKKMIS